MSISEKLVLIKDSISAIKEAIINKGQTPAGDITTFAQAINDISGGGESLQYIPRELDTSGKLCYPLNDFTFTLPSNVKDVGDSVFQMSLQGCKTVIAIDLNNITSVSGTNAFYNAFAECSNIRNINFNNLKTISGNYAFMGAFANWYNNDDYASANFDNLESITGEQVFYGVYQNTKVSNINMDNLKTIQGNAIFRYAAQSSDVTSISFKNLQTIVGSSVFDGFSAYNWTLESCNFDKLATLNGDKIFYQSFNNCRGLSRLDFPSLNENSFGGYNTQFNQMLVQDSGVEVHFPLLIKDKIENWSDVLAGFSGSGTQIFFDLNVCDLTFNILQGADNIEIWNKEVINNTIKVAQNKTYTYKIKKEGVGTLIKELIINNEDSKTITEDLNNYEKHTLSINVDGAESVSLKVGDTNISPTRVGNNYSMDLLGDVEVELNIMGDDNHWDYSETIQLNSDITKTITLQDATSSQFEQPALESDGELGGDSFAVSSNTSNTYRLFDKNLSTYTSTSYGQNLELTIYNPVRIKLESYTTNWYNTSSSYQGLNADIYGSNDGIDWEFITTCNRPSRLSTTTTDVNSSKFYKYHKIVEKVGSYFRAYEITLNGIAKQ